MDWLQAVGAARKKAGLPKDLVLYCGRHDYGTEMTERTGNLKAVMEIMGHVNVKTAMKYQHPGLHIVGEAIRAPLLSKNNVGTIWAVPE